MAAAAACHPELGPGLSEPGAVGHTRIMALGRRRATRAKLEMFRVWDAAASAAGGHLPHVTLTGKVWRNKTN